METESEQKEPTLVERELSKIQMAALVGVLENLARAKNALLEADQQKEEILKELAKELGVPEESAFQITPELQKQGCIKVQLPE